MARRIGTLALGIVAIPSLAAGAYVAAHSVSDTPSPQIVIPASTRGPVPIVIGRPATVHKGSPEAGARPTEDTVVPLSHATGRAGQRPAASESSSPAAIGIRGSPPRTPTTAQPSIDDTPEPATEAPESPTTEPETSTSVQDRPMATTISPATTPPTTAELEHHGVEDRPPSPATTDHPGGQGH